LAELTAEHGAIPDSKTREAVHAHISNTPKAFANLSLGLERSDNPRITTRKQSNPERVFPVANPFRVDTNYLDPTQRCRCAPTLG